MLIWEKTYYPHTYHMFDNIYYKTEHSLWYLEVVVWQKYKNVPQFFKQKPTFYSISNYSLVNGIFP